MIFPPRTPTRLAVGLGAEGAPLRLEPGAIRPDQSGSPALLLTQEDSAMDVIRENDCDIGKYFGQFVKIALAISP